jgi:hypothetical protein
MREDELLINFSADFKELSVVGTVARTHSKWFGKRLADK